MASARWAGRCRNCHGLVHSICLFDFYRVCHNDSIGFYFKLEVHFGYTFGVEDYFRLDIKVAFCFDIGYGDCDRYRVWNEDEFSDHNENSNFNGDGYWNQHCHRHCHGNYHGHQHDDGDFHVYPDANRERYNEFQW